MNKKGLERISEKWRYPVMFLVGFGLTYILTGIIGPIVAVVYDNSNPGVLAQFNDDIINRSNTPAEFASTTIDIFAIAQFIGTALIAVLIVVLLWRMLASDFKEFKNNFWYNILTIFLWFVVIYAMSYGVTVLFDLLKIEGMAENETFVRKMLNSRYGFLMVLSTTLLAPFVEEMIFRKFLIGFFEKTLKIPLIVSAILAAIIFGLAHDHSVFLLAYLPLALAISLSYAFSNRNVWIPIGVHFLNNLIAAIAVLTGSQ
ncbi:MAG: CPBP family intramembrane glutamic endopeptidase [Bacilli bacterium]|jgi:membrane protease YdiL (CAAX protease family)